MRYSAGSAQRLAGMWSFVLDAYAVIADVHGNRWALDAVVGDARAAGVSRFLDLGDCVYGPLDPCGTAERLAVLEAPTVRGNQDRLVDVGPTGCLVAEQLPSSEVERLKALPSTLELDGLLLCHGTPTHDTEPLLEEVTPGGARHRSPDEVARRLEHVESEVVLCAHTHLPRTLCPRPGLLVVNPGSVGLPAYDDDAPHPHVMESGSPHARYAILRRMGGRWSVQLRAVDYAWSQAAEAARDRDREDWAIALETGLALPTVRGGASKG